MSQPERIGDASSLPVAATAGTFGGQIEFSQVPAGILLRLEVADISAAEVSTLATDSIELSFK
ncbi:MAG TPA: hypothetical protein VF784_09735 [Anaerolineales bacterium]